MWQIGWVGIIARHWCVVSVMLVVEGGREGGVGKHGKGGDRLIIMVHLDNPLGSGKWLTLSKLTYNVLCLDR